VVKKGSSQYGLFLKGDQAPIPPSEDPIGVYAGTISSGVGEYHLELKFGQINLIIDGTPNYEHPLTCFGRMNEDIYNNKVNIRILKDGSLKVIAMILPGDELLTEYDSEYDWNWLKEEALHELLIEMRILFPWLHDVSPDLSLDDLDAQIKHPVLGIIHRIINSSMWTSELHSATPDPLLQGIKGLTIFLTSGITYEKYRFGGFGSGAEFPESPIKRGALHLFSDVWNGTNTADLAPEVIMDPKRAANESIRSLFSTLEGKYGVDDIGPTSIQINEIPPTSSTSNRITVSLEFGRGKPAQRRM
jgi:hypothetical protein